jgi:ABC-type glucose/galactose transport system permease subunit
MNKHHIYALAIGAFVGYAMAATLINNSSLAKNAYAIGYNAMSGKFSTTIAGG